MTFNRALLIALPLCACGLWSCESPSDPGVQDTRAVKPNTDERIDEVREQPAIVQVAEENGESTPETVSAPSRWHGEDVSWQVPTAWEQHGPSGIRFATIRTPGPQALEVSVTRLSGEAGGLLANINRWRREVGLEPIQPDELSEHYTSFTAGGVTGALVDVTGTGEAPVRSLVVRLASSMETWFFKMMGPAAEIEKHREAFIGFVDSVRLNDS
jgi:hypothetical protein